jgi:hypothetical protein
MQAIRISPEVQEIRFTAASFALLTVGWIWLGLFVAFGFSRHAPVDSGANFGSLVCLWFAPLALLGALAGVFFDRRKRPSFIALCVSIASSLLVLSMGG